MQFMPSITNIKITSVRSECFLATAIAGTYMHAPGKPYIILIQDPVIEEGKAFTRNGAYKITAPKMPATHDVVLDHIEREQVDGIPAALYVFMETQ